MSKVTLIIPSTDHNIEQIIATAANLSYSKKPINEILEKFEVDENVSGLFERSIGLGHWSIAEHASFSFLIEDISLPCGEQILRHRTGKYTKQSYRYQKANLTAVIPGTIKKNVAALKLYETSVQYAYDTYKELIEYGIPREDARYVIPTGTKCRLMITIDGRNLINFLNHRLCAKAQWEIRGVAIKMYNHLKKVAPNLAKYVTPPCADCTCMLNQIKKENE